MQLDDQEVFLLSRSLNQKIFEQFFFSFLFNKQTIHLLQHQDTHKKLFDQTFSTEIENCSLKKIGFGKVGKKKRINTQKSNSYNLNSNTP